MVARNQDLKRSRFSSAENRIERQSDIAEKPGSGDYHGRDALRFEHLTGQVGEWRVLNRAENKPLGFLFIGQFLVTDRAAYFAVLKFSFTFGT